jgi:hypothetical protein
VNNVEVVKKRVGMALRKFSKEGKQVMEVRGS